MKVREAAAKVAVDGKCRRKHTADVARAAGKGEKAR